MSATPTRVDSQLPPLHLAPFTVTGSPGDGALPRERESFAEGNRVLESIGRQEGLRALLAFSDLHEQIRGCRVCAGPSSNWDLFQTERFVRDEVLQLICDRTQAIAHADAVMVALAEGPEMVCRASAGPLPVPRGIRLNPESAFLRECLESGKILRCDDCQADARFGLDFAQQLGARSTVLVPLCGRNDRLGVLQAFSSTPWSFTDHDVRCFDLFAELVLAALHPEDQDRRLHWLSTVADGILQAKRVAETPIEPAAAIEGPRENKADEHESPAFEPAIAVASIEDACAQVLASGRVSDQPVRDAADELQSNVSLEAALSTAADAASAEQSSLAAEITTVQGAEPESASPDLEAWTQRVVIPIAAVEVHEPEQDTEPATECAPNENEAFDEPALDPFDEHSILSINPPAADVFEEHARVRRLRVNLGAFSFASHPGLSVVMGLMAVAALFSAGVWWGMQVHGRTSEAGIAAAKIPGRKLVGINQFAESKPTNTDAPQTVTSPPAPDVLSPAVSDDLTDSSPAASQNATLIPLPDAKLAALPKITGVRHWSSSMGSTVVIDMEDQVPYEVHRLMSPERIYFDLQDTALARELDGKTMDIGDASLTRVRVAQPVAGVTRVVLDTKDGSNFSVSMESNPYRLVVELRDNTKFATNRAGSDALARAASKSAPRAAVETATTAQLQPAKPLPVKSGKFRIVLDAGHGGWDLGTVGRQGLLEKDLVLDVTRRLGKLLHDRLGSDVMFTRTGDEYLPLDQRADFANQAQADLFVSVHANYSSSANARGVETYYTNLFSAPGSREIGSKELENHGDGMAAKLTPVSLSAGGLREKTDESRRLAASVQRSLFATLAAKSPDIRDRGIKDASFAVLTGTTMPAILTEISFVSSPADEHNLQSEAYRQQIAEALYKGIARYQEASPRSKVAQLHSSAATR